MQFDFTKPDLLAVNHLRFKHVWIGLGLLLVSGVVVGSVISIPPVLKVLMLQDKLLHTVAYGALMGWFAQIYRHDLTRLLLVLGLIAMGVGIEFIQGSFAYRQFNKLDILANTSGVVLAWALAYTWVGNILCWVESGFTRVLARG